MHMLPSLFAHHILSNNSLYSCSIWMGFPDFVTLKYYPWDALKIIFYSSWRYPQKRLQKQPLANVSIWPFGLKLSIYKDKCIIKLQQAFTYFITHMTLQAKIQANLVAEKKKKNSVSNVPFSPKKYRYEIVQPLQ